MNIGDAADRTGVPAKTIRYYEEIGLVRLPRDANGYRALRDPDVHKLAFIGRARSLGFSIEDCRHLLALYEDESRESSQVRALAEDHLARIDDKLKQLRVMRDTLADLIAHCHGDHRPDCPILNDLARVG
jgi:Cu(I)-responsive transcriptional regulator